MEKFASSKLFEKYNFNESTLENINFTDTIISYQQKMLAQVVANEDNYLRQTLIKYAKETRTDLYIFNADEVNKIFDLGLKEYRRLNSG